MIRDFWKLEKQDLEQTRLVQICFDKHLFSVLSMSGSTTQTSQASWKNKARVEVGAATYVADHNYDDAEVEEPCLDSSVNPTGSGVIFTVEHCSQSTSNDCEQARSQRHLQLELPTTSTFSAIPRQRSWLNDWKEVSSWYPGYKKRLQEYLQRRSKEETDNNNYQDLFIRTDSCWEYELKEENLPCTYQTILDLLKTKNHLVCGVIEGRTIRIKFSSKVTL